MAYTSVKDIPLCVGELIVAKGPVTVSTVLGSCVSVCLFVNDQSAGGMIHFALPKPMGNVQLNDEYRYASIAIPKLIKELVRLSGCEISQISAKIVGGSSEEDTQFKSQHQAGLENIRSAKTLLTEYGIPIVGESTGGSTGRKVIFHIPSGRLQVAKIAETKPPTQLPEKVEKKTLSRRKVLIVDDSKTIRDLLKRILSTDPDLEIVGLAADAVEADHLVKTLKPDVITLDIHMPIMTGLEWLAKLLPKNPIPVVMISSLQFQEGNEVFRALELGAVDYIQKPSFSDIGNAGPLIREKIKEASFAKVIRHKQNFKPTLVSEAIDLKCVLAIGASTGGTEALRNVLSALPKQIPPTVIVQHIPPVFSKAFADRMNQLCPFEVKEAEDGDELQESRVLIAPGGKQMKVVKSQKGYCVRITDDEPMNRHKPSVDYLFYSVAQIIGKRSIGVILTGMGADGAKGLLTMREKGSVTIGQDEQSSVVYGMPRAAFLCGAVQTVAPLSEIPSLIIKQLYHKKAA